VKIFHFCLQSPVGNFGDDILFHSVKDTFNTLCEKKGDSKVTWINYDIRKHTTENVIHKANECDFIVVGGGGLILSDTAPNNWSGWQWAIHPDHLQMIKKPLIVYAIGYNRFRNQPDFDSNFAPHIKETIEKSSFFSVRNTGSMRALKDYVISENINVQPCPTLFYNKDQRENILKGIHIGFNLAGDRSNLRYNKKKFYEDMLKVFKRLGEKRYTIHFLNHSWNPESNCKDLIDMVPNKVVHDIETIWDPSDILSAVNVYRSMNVVISMRYHGVLVPFGQRKKVIPIITHNKLQWFLEDANMKDIGVDIDTTYFSENLYERIERLIYDSTYYQKQDKALFKFEETFEKNNENMWKNIWKST